jgi:hypothetical protein
MVEVLAIQTGVEGGFFLEKRLWDPADIMVVYSSLISCRAVRDINNGDDDKNEYDGDDNNNEHDSDEDNVEQNLGSDRNG